MFLFQILYNENLWKVIQLKNYKWETEHSQILSKYNLSKYYQHGDSLWKLHDKSIEAIGKIIKIVKIIGCE